MPSPRITLAIADTDISHAIIDGLVQFDDLDVDVEWELEDGERAGKMLRERAFDACEFSMGSYMTAKPRGVTFTAIPVFPNRKFRHSYVFRNAKADLHEPRDLHGKRVGLRGWAVTACVWMKGIMTHYYGLDMSQVTWFTPPEAVNPSLPEGVTVHRLQPGQSLDAMLVNGELDAVINPDLLPSFLRGDPNVKRLFDDYKNVEQAFYREHRIFPISHAVVIKDEIIEQYPHVPMSLLKGFRQARDVAFRRIEEQQILSMSWASTLLDEQRALMGHDYWAYNLGPENRRIVQELAMYSCEQGLAKDVPDVATLFVPETVADTGI